MEISTYIKNSWEKRPWWIDLCTFHIYAINKRRDFFGLLKKKLFILDYFKNKCYHRCSHVASSHTFLCWGNLQRRGYPVDCWNLHHCPKKVHGLIKKSTMYYGLKVMFFALYALSKLMQAVIFATFSYIPRKKTMGNHMV